MSGSNQFLPFGTGSGANVLTPTAYAALAALVANGFQSGVANSQYVNTPIRQATFVSSAIAQAIADMTGAAVADDGIIVNFRNQFLAMFQQAQYLVPVTGGTADAITATYTPTVSALTNGMTLMVRAGLTNATTTPTFKADGTVTKTIVKGNGLALVAGDIAGAGHWIELRYDLALDKWVLLNPATGLTVVGSSSYFFKTDAESVAFTKTAAGAVSIKAGAEIYVNGTLIKFAVATAVTMPALVSGTDYAIYAKPDGTLQAVADPYSAPSAPPIAGARKIGGFHYGLTAPGTTVAGGSFATAGTGMIWTQPSVDDIAGINKYSLWDVKWRCAGEQRGMAFDPYVKAWAAIYWCPTDHITNGISAAGTDVASGSVLPRIPLAYGGSGAANYANGNWWTFGEIAASFGLRHPTEREFVSAAYGVTENQSLGGASVTIPATARQAGYTSRIGLEQASGHIWTWGADTGMSNITFSWQDFNGGRGQIYTGGNTKVLLGGLRDIAAASGSRASGWINNPWHSNWNIGLRAFGDHLKLA
jgi:hypothetical protein